MATNNEEIVINNYSDDSKIKAYINETLAPRVFHDIPLNVLNTGHFSLINEYMSQVMEQMSFTSSFYFNESFITKAVLPDSIYAEAAIFNLGYSFATPASTNFLLELKIKDITDNAVYNADNGFYEFILDKDTKLNLPEGFVYSLDYDILIQYKNIETASIDAVVPAWNVQYINRDQANVCATNKGTYITYRVTETWLCLLIQANEYERQVHTVTNNMTGGVPNEDKVIMCENHIAGFDVKYIDGKGNETYLDRDHILAIHDSVTDNQPYVHYIMDNPQTIRFMWQLNGNRYFVPDVNSSFEITIYTCHGKSANAPDYKNETQPSVISSSNKYSNNANVMKAAFVISGCVGGADIGTVETVRRETIEAYNTAKVISTDHDIDEWFKTFFFKNILYPFFHKRRDDPWGRIWSGYIALTSNDDYVYRTNTLHGQIPYEVLYNNAENTISNNEIIIPPGWIWVYNNDGTRCTLTPYTKGDGITIETVKTLASINDKFVFANPFGVRIQKDPFAIGYFSPWINQYVTATKLNRPTLTTSQDEDISYVYHATPIITNIKRTYKDDHYTITSDILPTIPSMYDGSSLVEYVRANAVPPQFTKAVWNYFKEPLDLYAESIPMLTLTSSDGYIPFNPEKTYLCVKSKNRIDDDVWVLENIWIEDKSSVDEKIVYLPIAADGMYLYGSDEVWGDDGINSGNEIYVTGDTEINLYPTLSNNDKITFSRIKTQNYYEMRISEDAPTGVISKIIVGEAYETELTKYGESKLIKIGKSYSSSIYINVYYVSEDEEGKTIEQRVTYTIKNAANVYMPYEWDATESTTGSYVFNMHNVGANDIILYADMKPSPETGSVDYYRVPFSELPVDAPMFYIHSEQLPLFKNNFRVLMETIVNGSTTGRVEMQPVSLESDGSYRFEATLYPLTELIDIDNRIIMASVDNGGGSWEAINGNIVSLDASDPQLKITILLKTEDEARDSEIEIGDDFTGYRIIDEYMLDDVDLVQELKEMRSVVNFGESSVPTEEQMTLYNEMYEMSEYSIIDPYNIYYLMTYAMNKRNGVQEVDDDTFGKETFVFFQRKCSSVKSTLKTMFATYDSIMIGVLTPEWFDTFIDTLDTIIAYGSSGDCDWDMVYNAMVEYPANVNKSFETINVNGGIEIQLMPFVEYSLMNSDRFESFVSSFTQVHKALEPVIFTRLEGNNYLDCKLVATYGLPHTYCSDLDANLDDDHFQFWPDLNVQIEFDVKLYNQSLSTNTINELRAIVKSYFNRITTVHTPVDAISMDNNIYISHVIQQMEAHDNVAYMKFKGFYTDEKNMPNGNYMDANYQAIVQRWKKMEDFPKYWDSNKNRLVSQLENFVPEMFVLEDDNIVINIIK